MRLRTVRKNLIGRSLFALASFALSPHYYKLSEILLSLAKLKETVKLSRGRKHESVIHTVASSHSLNVNSMLVSSPYN